MPTRKTSSRVLTISVFQRYRVPLTRVWDGVTQAKHLNRYFTSGAKGTIAPVLKPVTWRWGKAGRAVLHVTACEPGKCFEFHWKAPFNYPTTVRFEFSRETGRTVVRVKEWGWTKAQLDGALDHCGGWSEFLYGLKANIQYGIDLRR